MAKGGINVQITDVRVRKITKEGKMKAVVSMTLDDESAYFSKITFWIISRVSELMGCAISLNSPSPARLLGIAINKPLSLPQICLLCII